LKLNDLLSLRFDEKGGKETIQRALSKTKWLERFADDPEQITLEALESLYRKVVKKYPAKIGYIQTSGDDSFLCMIKNFDSQQWVETIYFVSFYECMAKVILVQYAYCIKGINFHDKERKVE
jgi:hypothetical protein